MFKKPVVRQSHTVLKSSVARTIRDLVASTYPTLTPADLLLLFPPKSPLLQDRLSSPHPCTVYSTSPALPLFFSLPTPTLSPPLPPPPQPTVLLPTVYALWLCPHLLPPLFIPSPVSSPLLRGADLMLPGILHPPALCPLALRPYQPRAVLVRGNPAPFGVGLVAVAGDEEAERGGWVGRGAKMVHVWGDELWGMGGGGGGNEGFREGRVWAVWGTGEEEVRERVEAGLREAEARGEGVEEWKQLREQMEAKYKTQAEEADKSKADLPATLPTAALPSSPSPAALLPSSPADTVPAAPDGGTAEAKGVDEKTEGVSSHAGDDAVPTHPAGEEEDAGPTAAVGSAVVEEEGEGEETKVAADVMDGWLLESLLYAVKLRLSDDVFPITPSVLLDAMEAANPHPHRLDLKASSHKRMAAFVKAMQKRGLLHLKAKKTDITITGVHHQHPEVTALPATKDYDAALKAKAKAREKAEREKELRRQEAESEGAGPKAVHEKRQVTVHYRYKPDAVLRAVLFDDDDELRTMKEVKDRLLDYVRDEELDEGGGKVRLDPGLGQLLPPMAAGSVGRAVLQKAVDAHVQLYHAVTLVAGQELKGVKWVKGEPVGVEVSVEQRQGKKVMTRVAGLERFGVEADGWAREAQRLFASSATVAEGVAKKGGKVAMDVLIQGDWRQDMAEKLHALYDIPQNLVHVAQSKGRGK